MRSNVFERKAERHRLVHQLRAAGASYKEISEKVGVNSVTIWKYLQTPEPVVPPRRALSLERQRIAREMKANGATYQEIGDKFGFTAASACELVRDGPPERRSGICPVCQQQSDELLPHHINYLTDEKEFVCRKCHVKAFHPEALNRAKSARADKRVDEKCAILKAIGWTEIKTSIRANGRRNIVGLPPGGKKSIEAPNVLKDLNALHTAVMTLSESDRDDFNAILRELVEKDWDDPVTLRDIDRFVNADAVARSEAFLILLKSRSA